MKILSETTHILCAQCARDNVVSNDGASDGTLRTVEFGSRLQLEFHCSFCNVTYLLPVIREVTYTEDICSRCSGQSASLTRIERAVNGDVVWLCEKCLKILVAQNALLFLPDTAFDRDNNGK